LPIRLTHASSTIAVVPQVVRSRRLLPSSVPTREDNIMAKSQKKSNKEIRKPKAAKVKTNASNPSDKAGVVVGLEHMKTGRGK
jgi:hypothetical protein